MPNSLRQKTISGLLWSFTDNFAKQAIVFATGIILARMLTPREFGLIGMITIFIAISQSFIDSGFTQALIRKENCSQIDYSTVFYFNIFSAFFLYFSLFFLALPISQFFGEPQLKLLIRVLAIGIIINASFIVQRAKLIKKINFKLQTTISVTASIVSGLVSIIMAYCGFAVWSLVAKTLISFLISSLLFWQLNKWKPSLIFSLSSFKEMFSFGSKLLLSGLIDTAYRNVYLLIIGKYFSSAELGYYTRADQFNNIPSQNITMVIQRVSYPVLSTIKNDRVRLKAAYRKLIKSLMLITFVLMIGLAAIVLSPKLSDLICLKKKATVYHALTLKRRRLYSLHVGYFQ